MKKVDRRKGSIPNGCICYITIGVVACYAILKLAMLLQ